MADKKLRKVSLKELSEKVDESLFENPMFKKEDNNSYGHFSSIIKEIRDGGENTHLIKIRPPLFYLSGFFSNLTRFLSGTESFKIMDNERWGKREVEHLKRLNPDISAETTPFDNAFLVEKIDGSVVFDILDSNTISNEKKKEVIGQIVKGLRNIHEKDLYHGEPTTQNCIYSKKGEIYWIDFEIEYHEDLTDDEKKSRDLEQLTLSILGAFEEEGEIGLDDHELIGLIFDSYGDEETISFFANNPNLPLIGPYRIYQLSFKSGIRFYQAQYTLLEYLTEYNTE